jgi:L-seryl-tRNA(Ser) seleniumtransferase
VAESSASSPNVRELEEVGGRFATNERRLGVIEKAVQDVPTLRCERVVPPIANHVPHLLLTWDEKRARLTPAQLARELAEGDPPVQIGRVAGTGDKGALVSVLTLQDGEERVVAERLHALLQKALG